MIEMSLDTFTLILVFVLSGLILAGLPFIVFMHHVKNKMKSEKQERKGTL